MMDMVIKKRFVAMKFTKQNLHILKVLGLWTHL
jgi:hypothetical protein